MGRVWAAWPHAVLQSNSVQSSFGQPAVSWETSRGTVAVSGGVPSMRMQRTRTRSTWYRIRIKQGVFWAWSPGRAYSRRQPPVSFRSGNPTSLSLNCPPFGAGALHRAALVKLAAAGCGARRCRHRGASRTLPCRRQRLVPAQRRRNQPGAASPAAIWPA